MTAAEMVYESELTQVERWRIDELERAGYDPQRRDDAGRAARRRPAPRGRPLRKGCSPELALQILL